MRIGLLAPIGRNRLSPLPMSFSAPGWSRMTLESVPLLVGERQPARHVGLDEPGDDVDARPLRRDDQVDAGGAGQLGDADDGVLDVARRDHHQVGELVDDHQEVRVGRVDPLAVRRADQLAVAHGAVEVVDVAEAAGRQVVVAHVHLAHDPLQRLGGLLGVGDDRRDEVRDALVGRQLDPLGVDEHHADRRRRRPGQDADEQRVDADRLAGAGRAGDEDVRRLGDVGADEAALDVLAERDEHRVVVAGGHAAAQDVAQADVLPVGVRDLDADRALAGIGRQDPDVRGLHGVGDVAGELDDPLDLDRRAELDLVAGDRSGRG
jgi:hypothetical protein